MIYINNKHILSVVRISLCKIFLEFLVKLIDMDDFLSLDVTVYYTYVTVYFELMNI